MSWIKAETPCFIRILSAVFQIHWDCVQNLRRSPNTYGPAWGERDLHLDDGSGVSDLSSVPYRQRVISELQVEFFEVDLDHLERRGMNMERSERFPVKITSRFDSRTLKASACGFLHENSSEP